MSQALLAPPPVAIRPLGAQDVRPSTPDAVAAPPFARQAATPGAWLAGLAFGLVCLGAGLVLAVACVVLALVLMVVGLVRPDHRPLRRSRGWPRA